MHIPLCLAPALAFCCMLLFYGCAQKSESNTETGTTTSKEAEKISAAPMAYIHAHYAEQFTYPQKRNRKCMCQFGYDIQYAQALAFPISGIMDPSNLGTHSYGKPSASEQNGMVYTCHGGFIDFSHLRAALDWTVYLTFQLLAQKQVDLPDELAQLSLSFTNTEQLTINDALALAQRIAWERLLWHEVASWYKHAPNFTVGEQQSAFTPEDLYSNFTGTVIGRKVAHRIIHQTDTVPFATIATEEITHYLATLEPRSTEQTKQAFDMVDWKVQNSLPEAARNADVWWNSNIVFRDQRYVFKRYTALGPALSPWLIPQAQTIGCVSEPTPKIIHVPTTTQAGQSLNKYYTFSIHPADELFFNRLTGEELHTPFDAFETRHFEAILEHVEKDMEQVLLAGFNTRDSSKPVSTFENTKEAWLP